MNQHCFECVFKHLSAALSYAKEVIGGYDNQSQLNHQIDLLGQLVNAEHHLQLIDSGSYNNLKSLRKQLLSTRFNVDEAFIDSIRSIYNAVYKLEQNINENKFTAVNNPTVQTMNQEHFYFIYPHVDNIKFFDLSYRCLMLNKLNDIDVIVLFSDVDLSNYDVNVVNKPLYDFIAEQEDDNVIITSQEQALLKPYDFNYLMNTFRRAQAQNTAFLEDRGISGFKYSWQCGKPQAVSKQRYIEVMRDIQTPVPLTTYFNLIHEQPKFNDFLTTAYVDKQVCCSEKAHLRSSTFACYLNEDGYDAVLSLTKKQ